MFPGFYFTRGKYPKRVSVGVLIRTGTRRAGHMVLVYEVAADTRNGRRDAPVLSYGNVRKWIKPLYVPPNVMGIPARINSRYGRIKYRTTRRKPIGYTRDDDNNDDKGGDPLSLGRPTLRTMGNPSSSGDDRNNLIRRFFFCSFVNTVFTVIGFLNPTYRRRVVTQTRIQ